VNWDVTRQVEDGIRGWAHRKVGRRRGGIVAYDSREGGKQRHDEGLLPTLLLER
jgi:hypothetical protein